MVVPFLLFLGPDAARAQPDFSGLKAAPGDFIYVTQPSGTEVGGILTAFSPSLLTIGAYSFQPERGMKIERRGDSVWSGAIIGAILGAALGATLAQEACLHGPRWPCVAGPVVMYGAIGALIDYLHKGRTTIFRGTPLSDVAFRPALGPDRTGLTVTVGF